MKGEDLKFLAKRADAVRGRPDQRVAEVHARIRSARRRRAAEGVAATSAVVVALVIGITVLTGPTGQPTDNGQAPPANPDTPARITTRELLYSEAHHINTPPYFDNHTFHFGDRSVETDYWKVHMDVTDNGFVYTTEDARLWFSDGVRTRQIGSRVCGRSWEAPPYGLGIYEWDSVMAGNAGSLVVWFECSPWVPGTNAPSADPRGTLVVFDTGSGREIVRQPMAACVRKGAPPPCSLTAVVGEHVYITEAAWGEAGPMVVFDVASGRLRSVTAQEYGDDIRSHSRGLVVGDTWQTGRPTDGVEQVFVVRDSRLIPMLEQPGREGLVATSAFDTATGRSVELELPAGYRSEDDFILFEWLDDDTVALVGDGDGNYHPGDILTCPVSDGRCDLTAEARADEVRLVPQRWLPG